MTAAIDRRLAYKTIMAVVQNMRTRGIINAQDYLKIEAVMAEKYGLPASSIIR